jgi:hypothetical protein
VSDLETLFDQIRARLAEAPPGSASRADLLAHVRSLARWHKEPADYPEPGPAAYPASLAIASAVRRS